MEETRKTGPSDGNYMSLKMQLQSERNCRTLAEHRITELHREADALRREVQKKAAEHQAALGRLEAERQEHIDKLEMGHQTASEKKDRDHQQLIEQMEIEYEKLFAEMTSKHEFVKRMEKDHQRVVAEMEAAREELINERTSEREDLEERLTDLEDTIEILNEKIASKDDLLEKKKDYSQELVQKMKTNFKDKIIKMKSDREKSETQILKKHHDIVQDLLMREKKKKEENGQATQYMLVQYQRSCEEHRASCKYHQELVKELTAERDTALKRMSHFKDVALDTIVESKIYKTMTGVIFNYAPELGRQTTMLELMFDAGNRIMGNMRTAMAEWDELQQDQQDDVDLEQKRADLLKEFPGLPLCDKVIFAKHRQTRRTFRRIEARSLHVDDDDNEGHEEEVPELDATGGRSSNEPEVKRSKSEEPTQEIEPALAQNTGNPICEPRKRRGGSFPQTLSRSEGEKPKVSGTEQSSVHMWQLRPQNLASNAPKGSDEEDEDDDEGDDEPSPVQALSRPIPERKVTHNIKGQHGDSSLWDHFHYDEGHNRPSSSSSKEQSKNQRRGVKRPRTADE